MAPLNAHVIVLIFNPISVRLISVGGGGGASDNPNPSTLTLALEELELFRKDGFGKLS